MRVVVAGGRGFIGREVVRRLLDSGGGHRVVVATRDAARADPWAGRAETVQAFAGDRLSLGRAFTRADVVVQCVQFPGHPVEVPSLGRTYMEVDGRGTEVAVETARRLGVRRFVYVSGAGAGQGRTQPWFEAKDRAEASVRGSGLEHAILRPSWAYGPGDRSLNRLAAFARFLPFVPVIGDGRTPVWPLHVEDLGRALADAALRPDATSLTLEVGGPERLSMNEVVHTLLSAMGRRRLVLHQPPGLVKVAARGLQLLPEPILTPAAVEFLTQEVEIDPRPAQAFFGFPFRTLAEGLAERLH